jgi:hypothetical protein
LIKLSLRGSRGSGLELILLEIEFRLIYYYPYYIIYLVSLLMSYAALNLELPNELARELSSSGF